MFHNIVATFIVGHPMAKLKIFFDFQLSFKQIIMSVATDLDNLQQNPLFYSL